MARMPVVHVAAIRKTYGLAWVLEYSVLFAVEPAEERRDEQVHRKHAPNPPHAATASSDTRSLRRENARVTPVYRRGSGLLRVTRASTPLNLNSVDHLRHAVGLPGESKRSLSLRITAKASADRHDRPGRVDVAIECLDGVVESHPCDEQAVIAPHEI